MPRVWDPRGWAQFQASPPPHWNTGFPKTGLGNPCAPGHRKCGLFREDGKGMSVCDGGGMLREYVAGEE